MTNLDIDKPELGVLPLVCICIPTFNAAETIRETLQSILGQSYLNLVVHISDNASTDNTLGVIESIADQRVTIHQHDVNVGGEGNFSRCIQFSEGKYTAIFHADDIYEPKMVAKQVAFLEKNQDVGAAFTEAMEINEHGELNGRVIGREPRANGSISCYDFKLLVQASLRHHNFLVCPSAMVRTGIYRNEIVNWKGSLFKSSADLDTWFRIARNHPIVVLGEPLMRYRVSNAQFSNSIRNRTVPSDYFRVMDYYLEFPEVKKFLTKRDLRNFKWMVRSDSAVCAANLFVQGKVEESRICLPNRIMSLDLLHAAMVTRRGMITMLGVVFLRLMIFLDLKKVGARLVVFLRGVVR